MSYKDKFTRPAYKAEDPTQIRDLENNHPIDTLYACLSVDEKGNEGIVSVEMEGSHFPLVFGDVEKIKMMRLVMSEIKDETKKKLIIAKFTNKEIVE